MTYKTILAAISGGKAATDTADLAGRLAQRFAASLEGFHAQIDPVQIIISSFDGGAVGMPLPAEWIDEMTQDAAATSKVAKEIFLAALARHGRSFTADARQTPGSATWQSHIGDVASLLAKRSRFFDLVILGCSARVDGNPHSDVIEKVICQSGRPVLVAPKSAAVTIGERIVIGWDGSAEAVKAVSAAMPFFSTAEHIEIVTIGEDEETGVTSLIQYLGLHGISASHRSLRSEDDLGVGEQLMKAACDAAADLLVIGGYGVSPWREVLFGGATRSILRSGLCSILLAH